MCTPDIGSFVELKIGLRLPTFAEIYKTKNEGEINGGSSLNDRPR